MAIDVAWPHRFVLREECDLWTAVPEVRDAWLEVIDAAASEHEAAIIRERERGVAPGLWRPAHRGGIRLAGRAPVLPDLGATPRRHVKEGTRRGGMSGGLHAHDLPRR